MHSLRHNLEEKGFCALPPPLPDSTIATLRDALSTWRRDAPADNIYGILQHNIWQILPPFRDALLEGTLGHIAAQLLGEPVTLFQDNIVWKTPGTTDRVQWHQDYAYWPLSSPRGLTLWLALDDADPDNGCLHYIPGTHTLGERQPTNFISPGEASWRTDLPPMLWEEREHEAVAATAAAGGLLAHDPLTWHMSPPNRTTRHRRAWSMTWIVESTRWDTQHAPHPFNYFLAPQDGQRPSGDLFPTFP